MADTENGVIGGNGVIQDWESRTTQKGNTGLYAPVSVVDFETLITGGGNINRSNVNHGFTTLSSYSSGTISNIEYWSYSYYDAEWIRGFLFSGNFNWVGLKNNDLNDKQNRFYLPFGNFFQCYNSKSPTQIYLLSNEKITNYLNDQYIPNYDYYGIGSTSFPTYYDSYYFSWVSCNDGDKTYKGYIACSSNLDSVRACQYSFCIWCVNNALPVLGTYTLEKTPETDPEKGIPSLPIGGAGDLVKKRVDEVTLPEMPTLGVSTTGALNVYRVGLGDLNNFISEIFHTTTRREYSGNDFGEMLANGLININNAIKDTVNGDITQFVVDMHIIPVEPELSNNAENIHIGGFELDSLGRPVTKDYVDISFGNIKLSKDTIPFYDGASDITGAKYKLFIPFIGFVDINPSYCWSHTLTLKMRFNVIDGSCVAFLSSSILSTGATSIIGIYSGSCCVHMPITGQNYSNVISGMLQTIGGIASSNPMQSIKGAIDMTRPNITMSNNYNASSSFMSVRKPYLLIEKPTQNVAANYYDTNGGYVNAMYNLSTLRGTGYTICKNVKTDAFKGLDDEEKKDIKAMLESGIYL